VFDYTEIVARAKEFHDKYIHVSRGETVIKIHELFLLAAAVVKMADELHGYQHTLRELRSINVKPGISLGYVQDLEARLGQVDDVLIVNHIAAKNGGYRKALADLITLAIQEHDDPRISEVAAKRQAQLATARKLINEYRRRDPYQHLSQLDKDADQFLKETGR